MRKFWLVAGIVLSALFLSGCGPSPEEYLKRNVSTWNTVISKVAEWAGGNTARDFVSDLEKHANRQSWELNLGNFKTEIDNRIADMNALEVPKDAARLHEKMLAFLEDAKALGDLYQSALDWPEDYTDEQIDKFVDDLDALIERAEASASALDKAQDAYAARNNIRLTTSNRAD